MSFVFGMRGRGGEGRLLFVCTCCLRGWMNSWIDVLNGGRMGVSTYLSIYPILTPIPNCKTSPLSPSLSLSPSPPPSPAHSILPHLANPEPGLKSEIFNPGAGPEPAVSSFHWNFFPFWGKEGGGKEAGLGCLLVREKIERKKKKRYR